MSNGFNVTDDLPEQTLLRSVPVEQLDGSIELENLEEEAPEDFTNDPGFYDNLAIYMDPSDLTAISQDVLEGYNVDEASREKHLRELTEGIDQLGLNDDSVQTPFEGGCTVFHPLIMENAVKIQAKAEGELLPARGPVRTQILGTSTEELEKQAYRVKRHMNYQLTEQVPEFYSNTQKALLQTALFGDSFKKNYYDPIKGRVCDYLIPLDRFVVNSTYDNIDTAERLTEIQYISEAEMARRIYSGQYQDHEDLGDSYRIEKDELGRKLDELLGFESNCEGYIVLEQHVYMNLPGFEHEAGVPLPYVICVEQMSGAVLSIRRNWKQDGNMFQKREWFTQYGFVPGFGFYNFGYIHLLGNFQMTLTAIIRSLVDAGSFANMQSGFKSKMLKVVDDSPIGPGEFKDVEFFGNDISKMVYPFNFKEPSPTLFSLLEWLEIRGQKYADSAEQVVADAANYGPVGTTMALLDASTKFFATVFKRLHAAQKKQFNIIVDINNENLPDNPDYIDFNLPGETLRISRQDYDARVDVIPVSDPNIPSAAHRVTLASQKLQSALQAPQLHDLREAYKQYYIALGDDNYEKYLPAHQQPQPQEPIQDIQSAINGGPIAAFPDQDHDAHIAIKTAFINDPATLSQQHMGLAIQALQANIRQHVVLRFAAQMDAGQQLGMNVEQAAQELAQFNKFKAENPLGTLDPKQLLAQAEMKSQENKAKELSLKEATEKASIALDLAKLRLEAEKAQLDTKTKTELKQFEEAMSLAKEAMKVKSNLTSKQK